MSSVELVLGAAVLVLGLGLSYLAFDAYLRRGGQHLLLVSMGFGLVSLGSVVDPFVARDGLESGVMVLGLGALYLSVYLRGGRG